MDSEATPIIDNAGDDDNVSMHSGDDNVSNVSMDSDDVSTPESEEFNGFGSNSSETFDPNGTANVNNALVALLKSNRMMQAALAKQATLAKHPRKAQKVYVPMPDKFDGKVGDFVDAWLEQFKTWFRHREQVEGKVKQRTQVETAVQNTVSTISLDLTNHQRDYGKWKTWKSFSKYMRETYGSKESGYTQFMRLRVMAQGKDSVNVYYARFRRMLGRQKLRMKHVRDNHVYYYMFIAGLDSKINTEVLRYAESVHMERMEFHEVLELAKRAEHTVKAQTDHAKGYVNNLGQFKGAKTKTDTNAKSNPKSGGSTGKAKVTRDKLTEKEREFLTNNINRGGGLIVYEKVQNKLEWINWAKKIGVCIRCAVKGHRADNCKAGMSQPAEKLNAIVAQDNSVDSAMDPDSSYLCSIHDRKDVLLMYHCILNKVRGTTLLDTGATRNYISRKFAEKANIKFKDTTELRNVRLPSGQDMKILGKCEFKLEMSEWSGMVEAIVLDLDAEFDIILGMLWHLQWEPLHDWKTLDVYVNDLNGAKRIVHKFGAVRRLLETPVLTAMEDWPDELRSSLISLKEAQKIIKGGAKAYLYFIREHGEQGSDKGDSERLNSMEGNSIEDSCSPDANSMNSMEIGIGSNSKELSSTYETGGLIQDPTSNLTDGIIRSESDLGQNLTL